MNPLRWRIRVQFGVLVLIIGLISIAAATRASLVTGNETIIDILQAYVSESSLRQQQVITDDFETAIGTINQFTSAPLPLNAMRTALITREVRGFDATSTRAANNVAALMRGDLVNLSGQQISSAWLMTADGLVIAGETAAGQELPFDNPSQSNSDIFAAAENLAQQSNRNRELLITPGMADDELRIELITLIRNQLTDEAGPGQVLGYFVAELNLSSIILDNLRASDERYETLSFLLLPDASDYLALPDQQDLVSLDTPAVRNVLNQEASRVLQYETLAPDGSTRAVIGSYANISVQDKRLALVVELPLEATLTGFAVANNSAVLPNVLLWVLGALLVGFTAEQLVAGPINNVRRAIQGITRGDYDVPLTASSAGLNEAALLTRVTADMRRQITQLSQDMNRRLTARNRDLTITQTIARAATNERDLQTLLDNIVQLIVDNFRTIYHAQIFLLNEAGDYAILRASTGEAGRQLLARGHRLEVGSISVIGQVSEQGQVVLARDTAASDVHRRNEFLSDTRTELAIPLRIGSRVFGALDVQSRERDSFPPEQVEVLQILANQISVAIENVRLFEQTQTLIQSLEQGQTVRARSSWRAYLQEAQTPQLKSRAGTETGTDFTSLREQALRTGQSVVGDPTANATIPFVVPVRLRNEVLGVIEYEVQQAEFDYDRVLLAEELVNRLAISLDNARLFQESQRATQRERVVNEISAKLTSYTDIEDILQTAIQEVGQALRTSQVGIRINPNLADATEGNGTAQDPDNRTS